MDAYEERQAEEEIAELCRRGDAQGAWARFLQMRSLWKVAQGRRNSRPGCDFRTFNGPYQRAFDNIRRVVGPAGPAALPQRKWVDVAKAAGDTTAGVALRVLSLNILSEHLNKLFSFQFVAVPPSGGDFLPWTQRLPLFLQEIKRWKPQLVALQEVDDSLHAALVQELAAAAELTACPFARRNPNPRGDGVCILYDAKALQFVADSHAARYLVHGAGSGQQFGGILVTEAFDVLIDGKASGRRLVAATAHVNPHPSAKEALEAGVEPAPGDEFGTDAAMAGQLLAAIEEAQKACGADAALLLGDLNGATDQGSQALAQAGFQSAYAAAGESAMEDWRGGVVTAHNDVYHWGGELDMILCKGAEVHSVLQLPSHQRLLPGVRSQEHPHFSLPMPGWPSDHMSLAADLWLTESHGC